jgi:3-deoxy-D-manno-octulosonate 8-phosphate phosphatase (KDO 8-P phosphatase)
VEEILEKENMTWENVAYIGDDINDIECIKKSAFSAIPKGAIIGEYNFHDYVTICEGGNGAVRDFISKLISIRII